MTNTDFTTAIYFGDRSTNWSEWFLEKVDDYFFLSGKKACVIANQSQEADKGTILLDQESPWYMTCLKVVSYLTVGIPLIMLVAKKCLRNEHHFHLIDPKQELENGMELSPAAYVELEKIIPLIRELKSHPENLEQLQKKVTFLKNDHSQYVFSLKSGSAPNLVFRMDESYASESFFQGTLEHILAFQRDPYFVSRKHFENMVKAKEVCIYHGLDKLVVPHAKLYTIAHKTLIAQERMPVARTKQKQEQQFKQLSGASSQTIKQLSTFIAKTKFHGVKPTHTPVIRSQDDTRKHIALINVQDLYLYNHAEDGFFEHSSNSDCGLIRWLHSPELIDTALDEAERQGIARPDGVSKGVIKARRLAAIEQENLDAF